MKTSNFPAVRSVVPLVLVGIALSAIACSPSRAAPRRSHVPMSPVWLASEKAQRDFTSPGAEEPADLAATFGLGEAIGYAAARNPRLASARGRWMAARERLR